MQQLTTIQSLTEHDGPKNDSTLTDSRVHRVAVIAPLTPYSGNLSTARRLVRILKSCFKGDAEVDVLDVKSRTASPSSPGSPLSPASQAQECAASTLNAQLPIYDVCFVLHAFRGGLFLYPHLRNYSGDCSKKEVAKDDPRHASVRARRYVLIFGGTDVNEADDDNGEYELPNAKALMERVISNMDAVVCFSESLAARARSTWPDIRWGVQAAALYDPVANKQRCQERNSVPKKPNVAMHIIPQSAEPLPHTTRNSESPLLNLILQCSRSEKPLANLSTFLSRCRIVLVPGGIRRVKGPEFAVAAFMELRRCLQQLLSLDGSSDVGCGDGVVPVLLMVGPLLQERYKEELLSRQPFASHLRLRTDSSATNGDGVGGGGMSGSHSIEILPSSPCLREGGSGANSEEGEGFAVWVDGVSREVLGELASDYRCVAAVNASVSEGQPQALIEVMRSGCCCAVARSIDANMEVVRHGETGLLAETPEAMGAQLAQLIMQSTSVNASGACPPLRASNGASKSSGPTPSTINFREMPRVAEEFARRVFSFDREMLLYQKLILSLSD